MPTRVNRRAVILSAERAAAATTGNESAVATSASVRSFGLFHLLNEGVGLRD
jgi:hypothetical protein